MSFVSGTNDAGAVAGQGAAPINANGEVSKLFTTLLVAQIRNQNPLEPQDPSEFVGQMTQLSQMEALQTLARQGSASAGMLESLQVLALGGQVGSEVMVATDRIVLGNEPLQGRFTLADASADIELVIQSAGGQQRRIAFGTRGPGDVQFTIDPQALGLTPGGYSLRVETATGEAPAVEVAGTLDTVRLSPSAGLVLDVANVGEVASSAVTAFNGRPVG